MSSHLNGKFSMTCFSVYWQRVNWSTRHLILHVLSLPSPTLSRLPGLPYVWINLLILLILSHPPSRLWWIILASLVWSAIRDIIDYIFSFYIHIYLIDFSFLLWLLKVGYFQEQMTRNNWFYVPIKESA